MGKYCGGKNGFRARESAVQAEIIKFADSLPGLWLVKVMSSNKRGCPDLLCCIGGKFVAVEVKTPRTRSTLSDSQRAQMSGIKKCGGLSYVVRSKEEFFNVYKSVVENELDLQINI